MLYILLPPLLIIVAVLLFLAFQPGELKLRRSIVVRCPPGKAFDLVRDLRSWPSWSPWLLHEPSALLTYSDQPDAANGWYEWEGKLIGAGRISQVALHAPERLEQRLVFRRPYRFRAAVTWEFAERELDGASATEIFWTLRGRMPFLMRFMAPILGAALGKDFELGLALLRARLDASAPRLSIDFESDTELAPRSAWTIPFDGGLEDMKQAMAEGFPRLMEAAATRGVEPTAQPFTAYHAVDPKAGRFRCDIALPVPPGSDDATLELKELPGGHFQSVLVQGSYDFLELAWHAVMAHVRMRKAVWDRARPCYEIYVNDPGEVGADQLQTRILVPLQPKTR